MVFKSVWQNSILPEIRIAGKWVEQCGFRAGEKILVTVCRNQIILKREVNYGE
ncbi:SymE family type I addiction module toxin [uncultured Chryseobacterium sp.]|uniref:SymE family type I addiction module toxin n=1 Tax=uncultured Chryseobacterium sp. TaxID=259322 RepID=UPI00338D462E